MTITLDLAPDMESFLREKAAREGRPTEVVAQALFSQAVRSELLSQQSVLLKDHGITPLQAAELRDSLASFDDEWNQPEMDIYNNYAASKARLDTAL